MWLPWGWPCWCSLTGWENSMKAIQWHHMSVECLISLANWLFVFNSLIRLTTNKTSNVCITGPFVRGIHWWSGGFPSQRDSNSESVTTLRADYADGLSHNDDILWNESPLNTPQWYHRNRWCYWSLKTLDALTLGIWRWGISFTLSIHPSVCRWLVLCPCVGNVHVDSWPEF